MRRFLKAWPKAQIKRIAHSFGFNIIRLKNCPSKTLLGLKDLPIQTVVDVGANIGQFAKYITGFFPKATIHCFEPLPGPFGTLSSWAKTQNERIQCHQTAIGNEEGEVSMHLHVEHSASSSILENTARINSLYPQTRNTEQLTVPVTKLDLALGELLSSLTPEILLKIDVQGYEHNVLRGAYNLLDITRAVILEANMDLLYQGQSDFRELLSLLASKNFSYVGNLSQVYDNDGHVIFLDAVFLKK